MYYIPYAILSAMTIPAVFYATGDFLCNRCNGDCRGVGMERAAVDCGGSGSLRNGIACITHRTMDIEQSSTIQSERCSCISDDFMQREIFLCDCSNGDCRGVGMERAAVDCGGFGSLWNGIACILIEQWI
ncbi:MAG: hypothetical protein ACLS6W_05330 [Ruminococcus sp.]